MGRADVDRPLRPDGSEADASDRGVVRIHCTACRYTTV